MSKSLNSPDAAPRLIAPTTTLKIAQRMLGASRVIAATMPRGFYTPTALDILLVLHVAEQDARYLSPDELETPGAPSTMMVQRWLAALVAQGLVARQSGLIALTDEGHTLVTSLIEAIYDGQRTLD